MVTVGFGRNNPFPFRLGGGSSYVGNEYQALRDAYEPGYDVADESGKSAEAYAHASAIALGWALNGRLANQGYAPRMLDALVDWEEMCNLRPSERDLDTTRRDRLAAKLRGVAYNSLNDIIAAVKQLLGTHYLDALIVAPAYEINFWPAMDPGPPGYEWSSNRAHVQFQVAVGSSTDDDFARLLDQLDALMDDMLPSWMTYSWHTTAGFIVEDSILGEVGI